MPFEVAPHGLPEGPGPFPVDDPGRGKPRQQGDFSLRPYMATDGLVVDIRDLLLPVRELGLMKLATVATVKFSDDEMLKLSADRLTAAGRQLSIEANNLNLAFGRTGEAFELQSASATVAARFADLSKLPKLSNSKFIVR